MIIEEMYIDTSEVSLATAKKPEVLKQFDWIVSLDFKNGKELKVLLTNEQWIKLKSRLDPPYATQPFS